MRSDALLSPCCCYRFALWRRWDSGPQVLFIMLNPSTADELADDPTVRRCIRFARDWRFGSLVVGRPAPHTIISRPGCTRESSLTIAAWGNHGRLLGRSSEISSMLPGPTSSV